MAVQLKLNPLIYWREAGQAEYKRNQYSHKFLV
jgi:hypothetical protein